MTNAEKRLRRYLKARARFERKIGKAPCVECGHEPLSICHSNIPYACVMMGECYVHKYIRPAKAP